MSALSGIIKTGSMLLASAVIQAGGGATVSTGQGPGTVVEATASAEAGTTEASGTANSGSVTETGTTESSASFDVNRFVLPEGAKVLVVVEGTGLRTCRVYAYEKTNEGWSQRVETQGHMGMNGMNNYRVEGDKTTPIGLFRMNTPFGQKPALEGFPENYTQVDTSYIWEDDTNRLTQDLTRDGERVGSSGYAGYYDYAIDAGYNPNAVPKKGSALFLHCEGDFKDYTSGCVAIPTDQMIRMMQLYGAGGDGNCYIAQAPAGTFDLVYDTYGVYGGLSPDGDFTNR